MDWLFSSVVYTQGNNAKVKLSMRNSWYFNTQYWYQSPNTMRPKPSVRNQANKQMTQTDNDFTDDANRSMALLVVLSGNLHIQT